MDKGAPPGVSNWLTATLTAGKDQSDTAGSGLSVRERPRETEEATTEAVAESGATPSGPKSKAGRKSEKTVTEDTLGEIVPFTAMFTAGDEIAHFSEVGVIAGKVPTPKNTSEGLGTGFEVMIRTAFGTSTFGTSTESTELVIATTDGVRYRCLVTETA